MRLRYNQFEEGRDRGKTILWAYQGSHQVSEAIRKRMRRLPENRRHLGPPAHVPGMRPCGLLRLIEESPRTRPLWRDASPHHRLSRARRKVAMVLHRRDVSRLRLAACIGVRRARAGVEGSSLDRLSVLHLDKDAISARRGKAIREAHSIRHAIRLLAGLTL